MSRTRVQQTQISGSLSSDILDNLAAGSELAAQSTLVGDLNAMRSQLNKIIGVGNWYDELAGTQDLADIQGAMQVDGVDAEFQGGVAVVGSLSVLGGDFGVSFTPAPENGYFAYPSDSVYPMSGILSIPPSNKGDPSHVYGDLTSLLASGTQAFITDGGNIEYRTVVSSTFDPGTGSTTLTFDAPFSLGIGLVGIVGNPTPSMADMIVVAVGPRVLSMTGDGTFTGDLSAVDATLTGNLSAVDGTFSGNVTAISGSFSAVSISGDVAQRLYIVGADGSMKDEANLTFDGSELAVTGNTTVSGDLSAIGGDFTVIAGGGNAEAGHLGYAGYIDGGGAAIQLSDALGNLSAIFPVGTPVAIYNSSDWSLAPVYFTSNGVAYFAGLGTMVTWVTSPAPAPFWGNDSVLVKVSDPAPAGASVLIQSSGGASSLSMNGNGSFTGDLSAVDATLSGDLAAVSGSFSGNVSIAGDVAERLYIVGADGEIKDEANLTFDGSELAINGDLSAINVVLTGDLSTEAGALTAATGSFVEVSVSGKISIDGDTATRLYIVDADGSIKDESKLTFDGSELAVDGDLAASGDLSAIGGDFSVAAGQAGGTAEAGYLGYAGYLDVGGAGQIFWVNDALGNVSSMFPGGTSVAIYNTDDWSLAPVYFSVIESEYYSGTGTKVTWIPVPTPAPSSWYYPAGTTLALVGNPAPAGASVLINTAVASPAVLSMTGSIKISGDVATRLYIVGADGEIKDESKLTFDGSELAIDGNLAAADGHFTGNVQVDGDLRVKGSMTYIDTQNMRVQDAFIYLATGSAGTTDSGIVLHGGAGADMDLVIGQDGGAGEVIFGKANRAPDGDGAMHEIELVPAWMSAVKLGGIEGAQSGSLNINGNDVKLEAANDLVFRANGWELDLMSAADYTLFDTNFSATSIVGALNELYAAGAGGAAKGNLALSDVTVDVLDFSAVGTLSSADHKFIDVYLNGVLLAPGIDVTAVAVNNVTLAAGVVSELAVDDVFTVVLRGAA